MNRKDRMAVGIDFLRAFICCSGKQQVLIAALLKELESPEATEEERQMALSSIEDALFPSGAGIGSARFQAVHEFRRSEAKAPRIQDRFGLRIPLAIRQ